MVARKHPVTECGKQRHTTKMKSGSVGFKAGEQEAESGEIANRVDDQQSC